MRKEEERDVVGCGLCRQVQYALAPLPSQRICCSRCGSELKWNSAFRLLLTKILGLTALILYVPANLLPVVKVDYQGRDIHLTIIQGIQHLFEIGSFGIAAIVILTSFLTPVIKILGLLFLAFIPIRRGSAKMLRRCRQLYNMMRTLNSWNSMETFLLAMLLTLVNFGALATINTGNGALAFAMVVVLLTAGTVLFQPTLAVQAGKSRVK